MEFASGGGCLRWRRGCSPVSAAKASRCALSVGHDGSLLREGTIWSAWQHLNDLGANQLLGRDMEPVGVALNGLDPSYFRRA
jgi:hypothetical protein